MRPKHLPWWWSALSPVTARPALGGRNRRRNRKRALLATLLVGAAVLAAGCSVVGMGGTEPPQPVSIQKLEYYPYQVKGYQNSYPERRFLVLMPIDGRAQKSPGPDAPSGDVLIGVVTGQTDKVIQHLYSDSLPGIVQQAIFQSAEEAGLKPGMASDTGYAPERQHNVDYVLETRIDRCWVKKHRGPDGQYGPTWNTSADFALKLALYKPPFKVPFWQGTSDSTYYDPPIGSFGLGPEDEVGIYDEPGQDLSVALTRAVAGIFQHQHLHTLIVQDRALKR